MSPRRSHFAALTAFELLVAIALIGIVAGIGTPLLRDAVWNARRTAALNALLGAVQFARSAALTRNATTVLCQSIDLQHCADTATAGLQWIVVAQNTDDGAVATEQPLRRLALHVPGRVVSNRARYEFRPFPLHSTNGTISLCDPRGVAAQRAIVISNTGRPRRVAPNELQGFPACETR